MGIKKLAAKVADYQERLERGQASKIKPAHVSEVLQKLRKKEAELQADLSDTKKHDKRDRLTRKISIAQEHISRAEWLLEQLD